MPFKCRPSRPSDATACATIISEWCAETAWIPPLDDILVIAASWRELLGINAAWVAELNGRVAGFCVREDDNITGLYVAGEARNLGIGKALLDLAKADRDWITVWAFEKNELARKFYRREGLVEIGRDTEVFDDGTELKDIEHRWVRPKPKT